MDELTIWEPVDIAKTPILSKILEIADLIANSELFVRDDLESISYNKDQIQWDNLRIIESPNTFYLYLQSLNPIFYLCKAFLASHKTSYLTLALDFFESWSQYSESSGAKNRYLWEHHAVAKRTEIIIYLYKIATVVNIEGGDKLLGVILEHALWLEKKENYQENHNHGIMQDIALAKTSYLLGQARFKEIAFTRLNSQLQSAFPNKAMHSENSIDYHIGLIKLLHSFSLFLTHVEDPYANVLKEYINQTTYYLQVVAKPDNTFPLLGDCPFATYSLNDLPQLKKHTWDTTDNSVLQKDGYAIMRGSAVREHEDTWVLFKSGYSNTTHKHADDLSILLYSQGFDILIDPGMYNYLKGNPITDYFTSSLAHNTIIVDNKSYSINEINKNKIGMISSSRTKSDYYTAVSGYNNAYKGVQIDRTAYLLKNKQLILADDIVSESKHTYRQQFHLGRGFQLISKDQNLFVYKYQGRYILLYQFGTNAEMGIIKGILDETRISLLSSGFNKYEETETVFFEKSGDSTRFYTLIDIMSQKEYELFDKNTYKSVEETLFIGELHIQEKKRQRLSLPQVGMKISQGLLVVEVNSEFTETPLEFSFWIWDKVRNRVEHSDIVTKSNIFTCSLKNSAYVVYAAIRNTYREYMKFEVGTVDFHDNHGVCRINQSRIGSPYIESSSIELANGSLILVNFDIRGVEQYTIRLYLYKNGSSYKYASTEKSFHNFPVTEKGIYTVFFKVSNAFWQEIDQGHFQSILYNG